MIRQGQVAILAFGFTSTSFLTMVSFIRVASKQVGEAMLKVWSSGPTRNILMNGKTSKIGQIIFLHLVKKMFLQLLFFFPCVYTLHVKVYSLKNSVE
jgi:hypothetical protein